MSNFEFRTPTENTWLEPSDDDVLAIRDYPDEEGLRFETLDDGSYSEYDRRFHGIRLNELQVQLLHDYLSIWLNARLDERIEYKEED